MGMGGFKAALNMISVQHISDRSIAPTDVDPMSPPTRSPDTSAALPPSSAASENSRS